MSKLLGMLHGEKVYSNDPRLSEKQCDVDYWAVKEGVDQPNSVSRCDYCGRTINDGSECAACGAPLR